MDKTSEQLEIKAIASQGNGEISGRFNEFMSAFEEFKQTNDKRLDELKGKGTSDVLLDEKLDRLNRVLDGHKSALDRATISNSRPILEGGHIFAQTDNEYKDAFSAYVKNGEEKALSIGSNPDGGYLVPDETELEIARLLSDISPIRSIAGNRIISSNSYKKPISIAGPNVGWVGETDVRPETASQTLAEITYPTMELYAMPAATSNFLDDAAVDVGQWIADEVNAAFAEQETNAFINGDGVNKPTGFLSETIVDEDSWTWGNIGYVPTGEAGAFLSGAESDSLIDLIYALKSGYRQNASWVMNRSTQAAIRKLKDADGNYIWQPSITPNGRATLLGFDLVEAEDMPDIANDATSIAFGDFSRGYLIVDRRGVNVLRDPYSSKPYVLFYTTKRVGGGVADFDAIKLLKFATS